MRKIRAVVSGRNDLREDKKNMSFRDVTIYDLRDELSVLPYSDVVLFVEEGTGRGRVIKNRYFTKVCAY